MKILHIITQAAFGGAQSVVIELSNAFVNDGNEVFVMSKTDGPMWGLLDNKIVKIPCDYFRRNISPINELKSLFAIKKTIKQINPDIIHLHTSKVGALGRLAAFPKYTKKIIYTMHGFDQVRLANRKFLPIEKLLKNQCKKIVAISNYDKKNMEECGITNVELIPNATKDTDIQLENTDIVQQIKKCANNRKIVMSIARDFFPKRIDIFIEVAKKLPEFCFIWIGNKNSYENIPENMYCLGELANASSYLGLADIFILISDHEGMPMTILEAFAVGVPAIASNVGGIPEVIDNTCGDVVENTAEDFIEKITELFNDNDKFQKMKKAARKKYEDNFTIGKMKNAYLKLYNA